MSNTKADEERRDQRITLMLNKDEYRKFMRIVKRERLPAGTTLYRLIVPHIEAEQETTPQH